jgi:small subunit ribosomal protein S8
MAMTDPLGDMLTRIRNGQQAKKDSVLSPASKLRARVLEVLQREGYIRGYSRGRHRAPTRAADRAEVFRRRACDQARCPRLQAGPPRLFGFQGAADVRNGLGITIVSTPQGRAFGCRSARQNVGGEVLAEVF